MVVICELDVTPDIVLIDVVVMIGGEVIVDSGRTVTEDWVEPDELVVEIDVEIGPELTRLVEDAADIGELDGKLVFEGGPVSREVEAVFDDDIRELLWLVSLVVDTDELVAEIEAEDSRMEVESRLVVVVKGVSAISELLLEAELSDTSAEVV